jgi:hypothetical protein
MFLSDKIFAHTGKVYWYLADRRSMGLTIRDKQAAGNGGFPEATFLKT